jgi:signal transduction histidine kinase
MTSERRVLIVDDDPAFRRLCKEYLREYAASPVAIAEASTASDAVARCGEQQFDCLLVDYNLPDGCGTDLLPQLRQSCGPLTPMIIMTGVGTEEIAIEALHCGAADYLPKERVSGTSLNRAVSNSIEKADLQHSIKDRNERLERANDELRRKSDQIQRFYHCVSHEIKTPLTAAREFISLVSDGVFGALSAEQSEALNYALQGCDQIADHFNELIEVTRLDTGKLRLEESLVAVEQLVTLSVASVWSAVEDKGVHLGTTLDADLPALYVDSSRIVQVLSNLLSNAHKFTDEGGAIGVFAHCSEDRRSVVIGVRDTGCGIAPHDLAHIFDRLYQADAHADSMSSRGLGLGLSIARDIVALHGGEVQVESQLGQGSVFRVVLPVAEPPEREGVPAVVRH